MKKIVIILIIAIIITLSFIVLIMKNNENIWNSKNELTTDFEIVFNQNKNSGKNKIISKNILNKDSCNIYSFDGDVKIKINGIEYDFKEALNENMITVNEILYKAEEDEKNNLVNVVAWEDGGTIRYKYETYSILKYNTIDGNNDFYIGPPDMDYSVGED